MAVKNSETKVIKRSQINLNPYNIKNHSDEEVKRQVKNIRENGYLGGIVWNEQSENLIDGHRRVKALDYINKYDGTNDYEVKVEVVSYDDKTEKEQMAFMALANSKADYNLVANIIDDVDYKKIGITDDDYKAILDLRDYEDETDILGEIETVEDVFAPKKKSEEPKPQAPVTELPLNEETSEEFQARIEAQPHMSREEVRAQKEHCRTEENKRFDKADAFVVVEFDTPEDKEIFCEAVGANNVPNMVVHASMVLQALFKDE